MKIRIDKAACVGNARCAAVAADLFPLDENGYIAVSEIDVPRGKEDLARRGVPAKLRRGTFVRLIVPDGVAKVTARYGKRERSAGVVSNTAVIHFPGGLSSTAGFAFYDAGGKRVKLG